MSTLLTKLNKEFTYDAEKGVWLIPGANEEQLLKFSKAIDFLAAMQGITQSKQIFESNLNYVELAKELTAVYTDTVTENEDGKKFSPSPQQLMAIESISKLLSADTEDVPSGTVGDIYSVYSILSGLFGTGKTAVVAPNVIKIVKKLLNITDEQIVYSARTPTAANNLARAVNKKDDAVGITSDKLMDLDLNQVRLIVIDEAFQYELSDINDLTLKVNEHNLNKPQNQKVRIFGLGDPSQVTLEDPMFFPLTKRSIYPVRYGNSLTAIYRTGINSIADAALTFHLNSSPVAFLNTIANTNLDKVKEASSVDSFVGVVAGNSAFSGEEAVLNLLRKKSTKTRLVITNNQAQAAALANKLASSGISDPNILVKSYEDAQSMTVDQVYLLIDPQMSNAFNTAFTDFDYNTAMYTSIGRAREFVFFANPNFTTAHIENAGLANEKEDLTAELEVNKILFADNIEVQNEAVRILFNEIIPMAGTTAETKEVAEQLEDETEDDFVIDHEETNHENPSEENDETTLEPEPRPQTIEQVTGENVNIQHTLHYPSSTRLTELVKSEEIVPGAAMRVVAQQDSNNNYGISYHVVAQRKDDRWVSVGILGQRDFADSSALSSLLSKGINTENIIPESVNFSNNEGVNWSPLFNSAIAFEGTLSSAETMKFHYSKPLNEASTQKKNIFDSIVQSVYSTFFEHEDPIGGKWIDSNNKINWNVVSKVANVVIYSKLSKIETDTDNVEYFGKNKLNPGFTPKEGIPYLVFKDVRTTKNKGERTRFIHVKLTPRKITKDHPYYNTLASAHSAITIIEALTGIKYGTRAFSDLFQKTALNDEQKKAYLQIVGGANPTQAQIQSADAIAGIKSFFFIDPDTKAIIRRPGTDLSSFLSLFTDQPDQLGDAVTKLMPLLYKAKSVIYGGTKKEAQEKLKQVRQEQGELGENFVIESAVEESQRDSEDDNRRV